MSRGRHLWLARAYYFFYFGAVGWYFPYINLYFEQIGLPGALIGALAAIGPLVLLGAGPLWGMLGDRFRIHRWLLPLASFGPILPALLMSRTTQFAPLAGLAALAAFFSTPIGPLIDSAVLDLTADSEHAFGAIRVWGSLGFTLVVSVAGYVLKTVGLIWLFAGFSVWLGLAGLVAFGLPARQGTMQQGFRAGLAQLLRQKTLVLFLASTFLVGASFSAGLQFMPLRLQALGGSPSDVGWANALAALSEMPFLFLSAALFRRASVRRILLLAYGGFALRWLLVGLTHSTGVILATQAMHGLTFGAMLVGSVAFVNDHTPPGLGATAQSLLVAVNYGLGAATGALAGGWLFDSAGASAMFLAMAAFTAIGLMVFALSGPSAARTQAAP